MSDIRYVDDPNAGYSLGLRHSFVCGKREGAWRVWNRHTGEVVWTWSGEYPALAERQTFGKLHELCGLAVGMDADTAAETDSTS